jgi:hypothetical protein
MGLLSSFSSYRCPSCASLQEVQHRSVSHRCSSCDEVWWWAVCRSCDRLQRVPDGVEAWRCGCATSNRSWWRIASSERSGPAAVVAARRAEETRLLPRVPRPAAAAAAVALLVAITMSVTGASAGSDSDAAAGGSTSAACAAFRDFRSRAQAGLPASPDDVVAQAESAPFDVRDAASRLLAASRASDHSAGLAASSDLAQLCHPNGPLEPDS